MIPNINSRLKKYLISLLLGISTSALATEVRPPIGMSVPQLSNEQRKCIESKMGKPGEGERPSRDKMELVMKECASSKPSNNDPMIGLMTTQDKKKQIFSLKGKIPAVCKDKINIAIFCSPEKNNVTFVVKELTEDAASCLKQNRKSCEDMASKECIAFENKLDFSDTTENCRKIKIESSTVAQSITPFNAEGIQTEGINCLECKQQKQQIAKLQEQVQQLQEKLERQAKFAPPKRGGKRPPMRVDDEELDEEADFPPPRPKSMPNRSAGQMSIPNASGFSSSSRGLSMMQSPYSSYGNYNMTSPMMMNYNNGMSMNSMSNYGRYPSLGNYNYSNNMTSSNYNYNYMLSTNPLLRSTSSYSGYAGYMR